MKNFTRILLAAFVVGFLFLSLIACSKSEDKAPKASSITEVEMQKFAEEAIKYKTAEAYKIENVLDVKYKILEPEKIMNYTSGDQEMVLPIEGYLKGYLKQELSGQTYYFYTEVEFRVECRDKSGKRECKVTENNHNEWKNDKNYKSTSVKTNFTKL